MDIPATKTRLRKNQVALRDSLDPLHRRILSDRIVDRMHDFLAHRTMKTVAFYWPMRSEADLRPLMTRLAGEGRVVALPRMTGQGKPLQFHLFTDEESLVAGDFGVLEPAAAADRVVPDVVIAPMLAFDSAGFRLGYGGGFYDRTLAQLRSAGNILALGVAYDGLRVSEVPRDEFDQRLDAVITDAAVYEKGLMRCG
ncbi:MAG: 5-formyltetrahydrofolate cyclo-ligase [Rhodospirillales bacterium]